MSLVFLTVSTPETFQGNAGKAAHSRVPATRSECPEEENHNPAASLLMILLFKPNLHLIPGQERGVTSTERVGPPHLDELSPKKLSVPFLCPH